MSLTSNLGEGQISVRFASTKRRRQGQWKLCIWPSRTSQDKTSNAESFDSESVTSCRISGCLSDVAKEITHKSCAVKNILGGCIHTQRIKHELPFLCYGGQFRKQTYVFSKLWLYSLKGAEKMYQVLPSSPTSKILKSNRSNRKRQYAARTQFDCSNEKR